MRATRRRIVALTSVLALAGGGGLAGCSVGARQHDADAIKAARTKVMAAGTSAGVLHLRSTPKAASSAIRQNTDGGGAGTSLVGRQGPAGIDAPVTFDFAQRRAGLVLPSEAPAEAPTAVFDRQAVFVQRANRRPTEHRVWAQLDFAGLRSDEAYPDESDYTPDDRLRTLATSLNPQYLLDLMAGTLAGSVRRLSTTSVDGTPTTHYRANVSLENAAADLHLGDDRTATRKLVFRLVGLTHDVNQADVWVAADGSLRRVTFRFDQRLFPRVHNTVVATVDLTPAPSGSPLAAPGSDVTIRLQRFARYVRTAIAQPASTASST